MIEHYYKPFGNAAISIGDAVDVYYDTYHLCLTIQLTDGGLGVVRAIDRFEGPTTHLEVDEDGWVSIDRRTE